MGQKCVLEVSIFGHFDQNRLIPGSKLIKLGHFGQNDQNWSFCLADGQGYFWSFWQKLAFASAHKIQK